MYKREMVALGTEDTLQIITEGMERSGPLYFSRFGDGDMFLIDGNKKERFHDNSIGLQMELTQAIRCKGDGYLKGASVGYPHEDGMADGVFAPFGYNEDLIRIVGKNCPGEIVWLNPIVFHYMFVFKREKLNTWIREYIWNEDKCFVGSCSKDAMEEFFGPIKIYIQVPERNAYSTIDQWYPEVVKATKECDILLPCAGMATRVINKRLFYSGVDIKSLDIGSLVDALDKKNTRTWIRKTSL